MTPQDLKNSILQLAIQGKLVEQRPEEGTGEDLYREILATYKSKKEKPLVEITADEIPFDIPESWRWVHLGTILSVQPSNGFSPKAVDYPTPYKNLTLTATTSGYFKPDAFKYVAISSEVAEKYYLEDNDILIQRSNSRDYVGTSCIYRHGNRKYIFPDLMMRMHVMEGISSSFIDCVLKAPSSRSFFKKEASGTSESMPKINQGTVRNTLIPLPPLAEQKRIVSKIEELLPLLARYEQAWTKQESFNTRFPSDLQKSLLQLAIQGKLVEQRPEEGTAETLYRQIQSEKHRLVQSGKIKKEKLLPEITEDEMPFDIPENWKWVRVAKIWSVLNGDRSKNYPPKSTLSQTGIPFISALNLDGRTVVADDRLLCLSDKQYERLGNGKLIKGDIVVCIRGSLGKHARYPFDKGAIASSLVIMRSHLDIPILDDFLMLYLDTPLFFSEIKKYDNGTAQPNLAAKSLEQFLFPLPPLAEQKRIVAKLEELLPQCDKLNQNI